MKDEVHEVSFTKIVKTHFPLSLKEHQLSLPRIATSPKEAHYDRQIAATILSNFFEAIAKESFKHKMQVLCQLYHIQYQKFHKAFAFLHEHKVKISKQHLQMLLNGNPECISYFFRKVFSISLLFFLKFCYPQRILSLKKQKQHQETSLALQTLILFDRHDILLENEFSLVRECQVVSYLKTFWLKKGVTYELMDNKVFENLTLVPYDMLKVSLFILTRDLDIGLLNDDQLFSKLEKGTRQQIQYYNKSVKQINQGNIQPFRMMSPLMLQLEIVIASHFGRIKNYEQFQSKQLFFKRRIEQIQLLRQGFLQKECKKLFSKQFFQQCSKSLKPFQ